VVEKVLRIDTRPSDGVAVAVRVGCPIYVAEAVMNTAAQDLAILNPDDDPGDDELDP
jgi:bifunctional DNase/RNase